MTSRLTTAILAVAAAFTIGAFAPTEVPFAPQRANATVTANIGGEQGGDLPYVWSISYDDVTRRVTATGSGNGTVTVVVTITTGGGTRKVQFLQPGRQADADTDFAVVMGSGPTLIGPTIAPAQVARVVGKIGTPVGGLPFDETWSRV